jgi:hypothetical protein
MQPKTVVFALLNLILVYSCEKSSTPPPTPLPPAPTVNAGLAQSVTFPVDSVKLSGSAHDSLYQITGYIWSEVSGPNTPVIADNGSAVTMVHALIPGTYVFQLMAVDAQGETGVDTTTITVTGPRLLNLTTLFPGMPLPYEWTVYTDNDPIPNVDSENVELQSIAWTIQGNAVNGRSYMKFNFTGIPSGSPIKSATLHLFSDTLPQNGNLVDANYGGNNDFFIQRVNSPWPADRTLTWDTQPQPDTVGEIHVPQTSQSFLNLSVDVTTMVNNMLAKGNYGFVMRLNTESYYNSRIFCSSIYPDSTRRPYLTVTF